MKTNLSKAVFGGILFVGSLALTGCGIIIGDSHSDSAEDEKRPTEPRTFRGYIGGVFEVTVDQSLYGDMEDFYTQEVAALPEKVSAAGYDSSWNARFDAQVGFSDLWKDMTVYISPADGQGFQSKTFVDRDGGFSVTLPPEALNQTYKIRANKRIGITLSRGETVKKLCYNFSAVETSAPFADNALPIVINSFVTTITAYACEANDSTGVQVPAVDSNAPSMLDYGQSKADVVRILGLDGLTVESPVAWCWAYRPSNDSPCAADRPDTTCDCQVSFDQGGLVVATDGISPSFLKK